LKQQALAQQWEAQAQQERQAELEACPPDTPQGSLIRQFWWKSTPKSTLRCGLFWTLETANERQRTFWVWGILEWQIAS
jgi:hypothetical protein